ALTPGCVWEPAHPEHLCWSRFSLGKHPCSLPRQGDDRMKLPVLSACACLLTATAFAQTSTATPPAVQPRAGAQTTQAITLSGCVGGGTNAQPYVLNNAMVLPQSGAGVTG